MPELAEKINEINSAFAEFKKSNDERLKQIEEKGAADPLVEEKVEKANEQITNLNTEIENLKTALNRPRFDSKDAQETKYAAYKQMVGIMPGIQTKEGELDTEAIDAYEKAVESYIRKGADHLGPEERKALSVGSDPDGGYYVKPEMSNRIITKVHETSPMRQVCQVDTIGSDTLEIPIDFDEASSGWVSELGSRSETGTPQVEMKKIFAQEQYAMPISTQRLLEDAAFNAEAWLEGKVQRKFERTENTGFVSGNGVGKPRGFTTYASGTAVDQVEQFTATASSSASLDDADDLIDVLFKLKGVYRANATWVMERLTLAAVRKLKDNNNQYIWQPSMSADAANTILGRPVLEADDMPSIGSSALAVAVGDFREGYQIVDRRGIRLVRDNVTTKGKVKFYFTKRTGGDVANGEAIKILKLKS